MSYLEILQEMTRGGNREAAVPVARSFARKLEGEIAELQEELEWVVNWLASVGAGRG